MCIVLDVNTIPPIFNKNCIEHNKFFPVYDWIINKKKGSMVYGGSKYLKELGALKEGYQSLIKDLRKTPRVKIIDENKVNEDEKIVKTIINNPKCNDHHLIAILRVSGCKLICTNDKRADCFIKKNELWERKKPKIYRDQSHKKLLCNKNIVNIRNQVN